MSHRFATALLCAVAVASPLSAQSVSYFQGEFVPGEWSFFPVSQSGSASGTEQLSPDGGNTGSNWLHTSEIDTHTGSPRYRVANINNTFTYNPQIHGALASLSFSYDLFGISTAGYNVPFFGNYTPTLRQNDLIFFLLGSTGRPTTSWSTFSATTSGTTNWVDPNNQSGALRPDFSANGAVIEFGYIMAGGADCPAGSRCNPASFSSRLDNFSVTATAVSTVPEPSTYALMAAGLGALMLVRRRRRLPA